MSLVTYQYPFSAQIVKNVSSSFQSLTNEELLRELFEQYNDSLSLKDLNDTIPECNDCYITTQTF